MRKLFTMVILLCIAGGMNRLHATTCEQAIAIPGSPTFPYVINLTCGTTDDINGYNAAYCGDNYYYMNGYEAVYVWTPTSNYLNVTFTYTGQNYTGIFLYENCPTSAGTCLANVTSGATTKTLTYLGSNATYGTTISLFSGLTYYIIVDRWGPPYDPCPGTLTINGTLMPPCSGTPNPGYAIASSNPVCSGENFTLTLQNAVPGTGVTYLWESSADGATWNPIGGTSASYATSQTASTWYRCQVTCSGNTGTTNPAHVTMKPFTDCYCPSFASSTGAEEIYSVTFNGVTNAYNCTTVAPGPGSILERYSNFTTLGSLWTFPRTGTVNFTIAVDECDGAPYKNSGCAIWIDFNQDGDYADAGERVYVENELTISPRTINSNFFIPVTALQGTTGMRITVADNFSGNMFTPCMTYGWGETEDYLVTIGPTPACPNPNPLTATNITSTSASLGWTEKGTATEWEIEWGPAGFSPGTGTLITPVTVNPTPISGLTPETAYAYYVRAKCGPGTYSNWSGPATFTTGCGAIQAPVCEFFQQQVIPLCWSTSGPGQQWLFTKTWPDYGASGLADHTGGNGSFAGVDGSGTAGLTGITLTSKTIDKSSIPGAQLRFFLFNNNITTTNPADEQKLMVYINDGAGDNLVYTWDYGQNSANWTEVTIPLSAFGNNFTIKWVVDKGTNYPFYDDIIIDDVCVEDPACPVPSSLTASNITGTQAVLNWTQNGTASSWDIELGLQGFTPTSTPTHPGVSKPYTCTGLTPLTNYSYYVRAGCSGGNGHGLWVGPKNFSTSCGINSLNYCQYFPTDIFPQCWTQTFDGTLSYNGWSMSNTSNAWGDPYEAMCTYQSGIGVARLVSAQMDVSEQDAVRLTFRHRIWDYNAGVNDVNFKVQYRIDGGAWTNLWEHAGGIGSNVPAEIKTLDFPVSGNILEVGWAVDGNLYNFWDWSVDDVCVSMLPASLSAVVTNASCPSAADGSIDLTVNFGQPPYTYEWSNGATTQDLTGLNPGTYSVIVTDGAENTATRSWTVTATNPVCEFFTATGTASSTVCYSATNTLSVQNFTVTNTGNVELVAGQKILILPNTSVQLQGQLWAYISTSYCTPTKDSEVTGGESPEIASARTSGKFMLFPNPTTGNFILQQKERNSFEIVSVEVYSMSGNRVMTDRMIGEKRREFVSSSLPSGVYFVKIVAGDYMETIKLVKTR